MAVPRVCLAVVERANLHIEQCSKSTNRHDSVFGKGRPEWKEADVFRRSIFPISADPRCWLQQACSQEATNPQRQPRRVRVVAWLPAIGGNVPGYPPSSYGTVKDAEHRESIVYQDRLDTHSGRFIGLPGVDTAMKSA